MPKISEERRTERREQILEGARRCFAKHGYEGATVVRLERAIGLSRGAIFNYFDSKEELFLELARRDNERLVRLWTNKGWEAAVREVAEEDPDWVGVYLEMVRRDRTSPEHGTLHRTQLEDELVPVLLEHVKAEQDRGVLRADVTAAQVAGFVSLVANGIAVQLASGEPIRDVDTLVKFVRTAVGAPPRD